MELGGYAGKLLYVDLSKEKIEEKDISLEDITTFIGGIGLATKIFMDELNNPRVEPFHPENVLIFMTGALTGTPIYSSSRFVVVAKSPLTNAWGEAHVGGYWGPELKRAGYDGIVVKGRASSPVYLYIRDSKVEIRDASKYWGLTTYEAGSMILREIPDNEAKVGLIGPAGENLVRFSTIAFEPVPYGPRIAGRTGMGAVMGSKNLKAIAVRGTGKIKVKDPARITSILQRLLPLIMSSPVTQILSSYGTSGEVEVFYEYGDMPIKNFSQGEFNGYKRLSGEYFKEKGFMIGTHGCWACPVKCWKITDSGKRKMRFPEYEAIASLGSMLLVDDPEYIVKFYEACNEFGLDVISTGNVIAWLMECYEKGIVRKEDLDGLEPKWGDKESVLKLLHMIAQKEGFGKVLAEGCRKASEIIGRGSHEYCMHVKGVEMPMHDPRAFKGLGLQYATSNRGADHLYGLFMRVEQGQRVTDLKIYERVDRFAYKGKAWMVATMEFWSEVQESMGLCKFVDIPPAYVAGLYTYVTGIKKTLPDLVQTGKRIFFLKRIFNFANGLDKNSDRLPTRFLEQPPQNGGAKGQTVELEDMLREFYAYVGIDENGAPRLETIKELGLTKYYEKYFH
ncbi:MAG: aldehyde ferredoxin oxidoreductase family protein [Thermofilum sp.]|nr:aldehyde ferredoxin oxidoreductase family protein [Thermofilum sp.]